MAEQGSRRPLQPNEDPCGQSEGESGLVSHRSKAHLEVRESCSVEPKFPECGARLSVEAKELPGLAPSLRCATTEKWF